MTATFTVAMAIVVAVLAGWTHAAPHWRPQSPIAPFRSTENRTLVWLGDGCFWERQYAYVNVEMNSFNRSMGEVTAHTGYAGSTRTGDDGFVCYHHDSGDQSDDYANLGQTEVTGVLLDSGKEMEQFSILVDNFFKSFTPGPNGATRPDPGDMGGQYRSVLGIPGGMESKYYSLVEKHNLYKMNLIKGVGSEDDKFNAVFIYDSLKFPFFRAETYMQFHCNFVPPAYPPSYLNTLFNYQKSLGLINSTGCPEGDRSALC